MNEKDYTFHTVEEISTPKNGYRCVVNNWWSVDPQGRVMLFKGYYPQCNSDKTLAEMLAKKLHYGNVVQIPVAYIRDRP